MTTTQRLSLSLMTAILTAVLFFVPQPNIPWLDQWADNYFKDSLQQAGITYATARLINGSISVLQESSVQVQPAGMGVSIAAGQMLDPLNDMVERLSDIMVLAITALGVQKLAYELSVVLMPYGLATVLAVLTIIFITNLHGRWPGLSVSVLRILCLLVVVRLALPVTALINFQLNQHYFYPQIEQTKTKLSEQAKPFTDLGELTVNDDDQKQGWFSSTTQRIAQKRIQWQQAYSALKTVGFDIVQHLLTLAYLYLGIFVIQVIALPLGLLVLAGRLLLPK